MIKHTVVTAIFVQLVIVLATVRVYAQDQSSSQDEKQKAITLFQKAELHKQQGDESRRFGEREAAFNSYAQAAHNYYQAYEITKHSILLYNAAQMHRIRSELTPSTTDVERALVFYQAYIDTQPEGHAAEQARSFLLELMRIVADDEIYTYRTNPTINMVLNAPINEPNHHHQPPHRPQPKEPIVGAPVYGRRDTQRSSFITIAGVTGVILGLASGGFALNSGLEVHSLNRRLSDHPVSEPWSEAERQLIIDRQNSVRNAWIAAGLGSAALSTGILVYVLGSPSETTQTSWMPAILDQGFAATYVRSF